MPRHYHLATQTAAGTVVVDEAPATTSQPADVIPIRRRTVDTVLIAAGALVALVLIVAGALLTWGSNFADDYVSDELTSQNIFFPDAASLEEEGRTDLVEFADQQVTTGAEAEAYASYIGGHLEETAGGATYADLGGPQREARAAVEEAQASGADEETIAELQATAARAHQPARQPVPGRDAPRAAAVDLRLVDDRPHRRHRGGRRLRGRGGDDRAGGPGHRPSPEDVDHLTDVHRGAQRARPSRPGPLRAHRPATQRRDQGPGDVEPFALRARSASPRQCPHA